LILRPFNHSIPVIRFIEYIAERDEQMTAKGDWVRPGEKTSLATFLGTIRHSSDKLKNPRGKPVRIFANPAENEQNLQRCHCT
jgi:hypothetical protein